MVFAQNISNVGVEEFRKLIGSNNGIILDVRTPEEVAGGYIEGASFINYYDPDFKRKIGLMQKDKPVYVYCASGGRSSGAVKTMAQLGFNDLYNLNGGIRAWQAANFPITKSTAKADKNIRSLSLEEFRSKLGGQQLVLVDFHTVWCAPCKKMAPIVDELQNEYKGRAGVLRVDADKSKEVANHYKVVGVPVFILYKSGKAVWRHTGIIGKKELQQIIDQHL
tara:strand:- start:1674 stop:2339 length:666 start_codon:yes stop_codon:yes gene_type:complete